MKHDEKIAIVTGASTGIGRSIALMLAKNGISVVLIARREKKLEETKAMIEEADGKAYVFRADLSEVDSIRRFSAGIKRRFPKVDFIINVAGIWHGKDEVYANCDFEKFPEKVILDTYNVGITAPTLLSRAFIPMMGRGSKIVNISGTFADGAKGWLPYYVSKRAIEDLTIGLSKELEDEGIAVNCISPADTATEEYKKYFPEYIKDANDPIAIAKFVAYLCLQKEDSTGKVWVIKKGKKPYIGFHN